MFNTSYIVTSSIWPMMRESTASRHSWFIALSFLIMVLFTSLMVLSADAQEAKAVLEIEEDNYDIDVSPESQGSVDIGISVRSTVARNTVYDVHYELVGGSTWSVDIPTQIYMEPLTKKVFDASVTAPSGEPARKEVELRIWVSGEGDSISWESAISGDSCTIKVMPYQRASIEFENDYLLDQELEGSFTVTVENVGNDISLVGLEPYEKLEYFSIPTDREQLEPGEGMTIEVNYDLTGASDIVTLTLYSSVNRWLSWEGYEVEFVPDGGLLHILFRRGPFMILVPQPLAEDHSVTLFALGGDLTNCGFEVVEGPEGAYIDSLKGFDLPYLKKKEIDLEFGGFHGSRTIVLRGYGYDGENRVASNPWVVRVDLTESIEAFVISTPVVVGGSAAAASAILAGSAAYFYTASEVFKYRWLTLAFVPLYAIAHEEKVLDHFFRGRLFEYIKEHPGVTFSALKEHFEVNNGTLTYHLHKLEREELITYRNLGKYKLFYADGMRIKGVEVVISPLDKAIIEMISKEPGITSSQVIALVGDERSRRTVSRHLKQLERKRFIRVEKSHGARRLYITGDLERVLMPRKGVVEVSDVTGAEA